MEWAKIFSSKSHEIYKRKMLIQVEVKLRSLHYASEFPFFTMVKRPKICQLRDRRWEVRVNDGATGEGQHSAVENGSKNSFCLVAILYWIDTFTKADSIGGPMVLCANVDTIIRGLEDSVKRMEKVNRLSTRLIHFTKQMIEAPLLWISMCDDVEVFGEEWCGLLLLSFCLPFSSIETSDTIVGWKWSFILSQSFCLQFTHPTPSLPNPRAMGAMWKLVDVLTVVCRSGRDARCRKVIDASLEMLWEVTVSLVEIALTLVFLALSSREGFFVLRGIHRNFSSAPIDFFSPVNWLAHIFGCNWRVSGVKSERLRGWHWT